MYCSPKRQTDVYDPPVCQKLLASQLQGVNPLHRLVENGYFPHCQEPLYFDPISVLFPTISMCKLKASKSPKHTSFHADTQACEVVHVLKFFFLPDKDLH